MVPARQNRWWILAAGAFTVLWFAMLFGRPLYDPDEGRYAEIPREMLAGGDWIIPHLNGFIYLEKPPLQYWMTALSFACCGETEGSARLYTGLCGYLTLLLVFLMGRRVWGFEAGIKALLLTVGSILFVLLGHQLTLDMALCFYLVCSLAGFVYAQTPRHESRPEPRPEPRAGGAAMLGCWAAMALAVLTKGLIGVLIPGFTLLVYVLWQRDTAVLRRLNLRWGIPLFLALAVPWFVLAAGRNAQFLQFFFIREHFQRFLTPIEQRSEPWWFFAPVLIVAVLPWLSRAAQALVGGWRAAAPRGQFDPRRVFWIWSVFVLVFFSLSDAKLIPYILPAIPTLALLCAAPRAAGRFDHLLAGAVLSFAFALGTAAYASAIWSSASGRALAVELRPALLGTSTALGLGALTTAILARRGRRLAALACLCSAWFAAAVTITLGAISVEQFFSAKDIAAALAGVAPKTPIYTVQTYAQSLPFYLGRDVTLVDYRDEFAFGQGQNSGSSLAGIEAFSRQWLELTDGFAIMPVGTRDRLTAARLPLRELARFPNRIVLVSRR
jgi:4-amino-4-deoxy-L-arabinose transferase-like glycosyltransferase